MPAKISRTTGRFQVFMLLLPFDGGNLPLNMGTARRPVQPRRR